MSDFTLADVARATGATLRSDAVATGSVTGATLDSRKVKPGYLFAALSGSHQDGAAFVADAVRRGAVAILAAPDAAFPPLDPGIVRWLHTPPADQDAQNDRYAAGWIVRELDEGGTRHWHNGSLGTFYAYAEILPEAGVGLAVALNAPDQRERIPHAISDALARRRAREAAADADGPK